MSSRSEPIGPTAHYTGYTWYRQGWSHPALVTQRGRLLHLASRPLLAGLQLIGGASLESILVARHRAIDGLLGQAIADGRIGQVIEVAAGLSPRGWDFMRRHGSRLRYIEADLPLMAAAKRRRLAAIGPLPPGHEVVDLDALADEGPQSLAALARRLDPQQGTAIITEGLLNYFSRDEVLGMWRRFAQVLSGFPQGLYFSDLHLQQGNRSPMTGVFSRILGRYVRGGVHFHFNDAAEAEAALRDCGLSGARVCDPRQLPGAERLAFGPGIERVKIVVASV
ncbi:MAG TPA: class I SAM-dependent methyltransferase [Solimonas sp.]|nr:class I SAM-dependent methyltransferase [Solimonas sp.]